jgi:hypothetical protein
MGGVGIGTNKNVHRLHCIKRLDDTTQRLNMIYEVVANIFIAKDCDSSKSIPVPVGLRKRSLDERK